MASRLLVRGSNINYVNRNGYTALHICVQNKLIDATNFLLLKGANPHIMDFEGKDACDHAKDNGMAQIIQVFNNCNPKIKVKAEMPNLHQVKKDL